jgi:uncharacterized protein YbaR (Trm112 family)
VHVHLIDRLVCPRCGPPFGLILLADRVAESRALAGSLGCPNCRDRFPVEYGFADLRPPPRDPLPEPGALPVRPDSAAALELAALLGVSEGPAHVLLAGEAVWHAEGLAALVPELEVVAVGAALRSLPEEPGVSRLAAGPALPFRDSALRAVALGDESAMRWLEEAVRVVVPGGRVVLRGAAAGTPERARSAGLAIVLEAEGLLVTERAGPRRPTSGVRLPVV